MKKILGFAVALALLAGVAVAQTVVTNQGQVITVTTFSDMQAATDDTNVTTLVAAPYATRLIANDVDLTAADMTAYDPLGPGQLAISLAATGATKIVYGSKGWTTNDWILIK